MLAHVVCGRSVAKVNAKCIYCKFVNSYQIIRLKRRKSKHKKRQYVIESVDYSGKCSDLKLETKREAQNTLLPDCMY